MSVLKALYVIPKKSEKAMVQVEVSLGMMLTLKNIKSILIAREVFHLDKSALNDSHELNMPVNSVTFSTFHSNKSELKRGL